MSTATILWVVVLSGAGTFLIRFLPMAWQSRSTAARTRHGVWRRVLDAIGPAAIVALLAVSLWGLLEPSMPVRSGLPVLAGLAGVWLGRRCLGSIAWATLAGVMAYGAVLGLLPPVG